MSQDHVATTDRIYTATQGRGRTKCSHLWGMSKHPGTTRFPGNSPPPLFLRYDLQEHVPGSCSHQLVYATTCRSTSQDHAATEWFYATTFRNTSQDHVATKDRIYTVPLGEAKGAQPPLRAQLTSTDHQGPGKIKPPVDHATFRHCRPPYRGDPKRGGPLQHGPKSPPVQRPETHKFMGPNVVRLVGSSPEKSRSYAKGGNRSRPHTAKGNGQSHTGPNDQRCWLRWLPSNLHYPFPGVG